MVLGEGASEAVEIQNGNARGTSVSHIGGSEQAHHIILWEVVY